MRVLVFGGTGQTGRLFMARAADAGHELTAFVRDPKRLPRNEKFHPIVGDARDAQAVTAAVAGHDAIVSLIGPKGRERLQHFVARATSAMLDGMRRHGVRRLIVASAVGVGESRAEAPALVRYFIAPLLLRATYRDRAETERRVMASEMDWTIVRPVYLTNEPPAGTWHVAASGRDVEPVIPRADLAHFLVDELEAGNHLRRAVAVGG